MSDIERRHIAGIDFSIAQPSCSEKKTETLVCLHGIGGDDASFLPQLQGLSKQCRIIAWNMPGYRQSDPLPDFSFAALVELLEALLIKLDIQQVHLMGQSIGGMLAQEFFHIHAQRVRSLILVATTAAFGGRDSRFRDAFLAARLEPLDAGKSMAELAAEAVPQITGKLISAKALQAAIASMAAVDAEVYRQVLSCLVGFNRRLELPQINCPVCLIAGSEDNNSPASTMQKMANKLQRAEFHKIAGAGHLVNLEQGQEVNQIILEFLHRFFPNE